MRKRFLSLFCVLALCQGMLSVTALAEWEHTNHSGWTALGGNTTTLSNGNYFLSGDVEHNGAITVTGTVTLCLNGHVLDLNEQYIKVNSGASLTLCDCTSGTTSGYLGRDGLWHPGSPTDEGATTCNLTGGVITGGNGQTVSEERHLYNCGGGVVVSGGGTFTMTGGNVAGNTGSGGGVYLSKDGAFTMKGGSITGNSTTNLGGGVFVDFGTFTMEGGKITGNASASNGGGVFVNSGSFTMSGGDIAGNTAGNLGGGVCINGTFNMSGGDIAGNTAGNLGGGVYLNSGTFTMNSGSITGNAAYRGGGVFMNVGTFTLSGNPTITGNTKADETTVNNVDLYQLYAKPVITIGEDGLSPVASIGVTMDKPGVFTSGWSTHMKDKDTADYFFSDRTGYHVALGDGEASMTANSYTVTFNANGGEGRMESQIFTYGTAQNLTSNGFTRTGYTFAGWSTTANGNVVYTDGQRVSNLTSKQGGTVTLYAQWTVNTYSITYDLDGGNASGNPTSYTVESSAITLNAPTRTGYTFAGWTGTELSEASTTVTIATGSTGDRNYTATWTANTYTVTFDANGGEGSMDPQPFTYDASQNLTANGFTRTGYTFAGWSTSEGGSVVYSNGQSVSNLTADQNGNVTLYAQWTVNTYNVTLHLNGGKFVEGYQGVTSYTYGTTTLLPDAEQMTRSGYRFDGWYADEKFQDGPYTEISDTDVGNKEFYARWTMYNIPETHEITVVDPANGTIRVNPSNGSAGTLITVTATPDEGYELAYITVDGEKISGSTFRMPDKGVTVSAVFVPVSFPFVDVRTGDWFYDYVAYVYSNGLMDGTSATTFEPNANMTRAMVWTIIARAEGVDTDGGATWYAKAQEWVVAKGISDGKNPSAAITRQELVTMLWRLAGEPVVNYALTAPDADAISGWAYEAMRWAVSEGIIEGDENGLIHPTATCTRAEAAAILMRLG